MSNNYPKAGKNASKHLAHQIKEFRSMSDEERAQMPLLYFILGQGTPAFKMDKRDVDYKKAEGKETCGNCFYAYQKVKTGKYICSWVTGKIRPEDWCNKWRI